MRNYKNNRRNLKSILILICILLITSISFAQNIDQEANKVKLYTEIAGEWELDVGGRLIPFRLVLENDKLYFDAGIEGIDPEEMVPVKDEEMKFESVDPNGDDVEFTFKKDENGKITGCTIYIPSRDAEAEAVKISDGESKAVKRRYL
ncbi:MAG: hypothetical protein GY863_03675 [bacterium]|nr:hypothetical protein [bacterium]